MTLSRELLDLRPKLALERTNSLARLPGALLHFAAQRGKFVAKRCNRRCGIKQAGDMLAPPSFECFESPIECFKSPIECFEAYRNRLKAIIYACLDARPDRPQQPLD